MLNKEGFINKYLKVPVEEYKNCSSEKPIVSICVQTYQQVSYIGKCLDGLLMQETTFDFEILLGEDASNDGTREICISYAKKFPNRIRLFLHSRENNILVYGKPTAKFNYNYNIFHSRGKYIAICEGDDFWTDPFKLQKQVDFLEKYHDYGMVYSDIDMIDENGNKIVTDFYHKLKTKYSSGNIFWKLLESNFINTLTVCVRKDIVKNYVCNFQEDFYYDYRLWLHVAACSKIKYMPQKFANYRVHNQGISRSNDFFIKRNPLVRQAAIVFYMAKINFNNKLINKDIYAKSVISILRNKNLDINEKKPIIKLFIANPILLIYIFRWLSIKLINKISFK